MVKLHSLALFCELLKLLQDLITFEAFYRFAILREHLQLQPPTQEQGLLPERIRLAVELAGVLSGGTVVRKNVESFVE